MSSDAAVVGGCGVTSGIARFLAPPPIFPTELSGVPGAGQCHYVTVPCLCGVGGEGICREWGCVPGHPQCRVQGGWLLRPLGGGMSGSFAPCLDRSAGCGEGAGCLLALISMLFK